MLQAACPQIAIGVLGRSSETHFAFSLALFAPFTKRETATALLPDWSCTIGWWMEVRR